jgi:hypothetical protein
MAQIMSNKAAKGGISIDLLAGYVQNDGGKTLVMEVASSKQAIVPRFVGHTEGVYHIRRKDEAKAWLLETFTAGELAELTQAYAPKILAGAMTKSLTK